MLKMDPCFLKKKKNENTIKWGDFFRSSLRKSAFAFFFFSLKCCSFFWGGKNELYKVLRQAHR